MRKVRSYVMRKKRLTSLQRRALENYKDTYCIAYGEEGKQELQEFLSSARSAVLEIGFGMGDATAEIAASNPGTNYLGIEVFEPGIGKLLHETATRDLSNLRIIAHDAAEVIHSMIPEDSLDGVHIFFPDPWPKKRHHKRRLIQREFMDRLVLLLKDGGYVYAVTDWEDYAQQILSVFDSVPSLINPCGGFSPRVSWRPKSKFEQKGLKKQHQIKEIWAEKRVRE